MFPFFGIQKNRKSCYDNTLARGQQMKNNLQCGGELSALKFKKTPANIQNTMGKKTMQQQVQKLSHKCLLRTAK